jgi:hypothetical protein
MTTKIVSHRRQDNCKRFKEEVLEIGHGIEWHWFLVEGVKGFLRVHCGVNLCTAEDYFGHKLGTHFSPSLVRETIGICAPHMFPHAGKSDLPWAPKRRVPTATLGQTCPDLVVALLLE